MKLSDWMLKNNVRNKDLALKLGVTVQSIANYRGNKRIPTHEVMNRILETTSNAVAANDFYHHETDIGHCKALEVSEPVNKQVRDV